MCKKIIEWTMHDSVALQHLGLTLLRISFGAMLCIFGYKKLLSGSSNLTQIGSAISYFGITRGYLLWGYIAALTELCGGLAYVLGFYTRIASLPIAFLLIVALKFHIQKGDSFSTWSFACMCLCIVIAFFIAGSGMYSIDHLLHKHIHTTN
jgi:putative oxidoreductase